jgi:anti-sigma factor RsiW
MPLNCPIDAEEIAERYAMGKLAGKDLVSFEQHLLTCSRCTELVRQVREFIAALKAANRDL